MANGPEDLKNIVKNVSKSNNDAGLYYSLVDLKLI